MTVKSQSDKVEVRSKDSGDGESTGGRGRKAPQTIVPSGKDATASPDGRDKDEVAV